MSGSRKGERRGGKRKGMPPKTAAHPTKPKKPTTAPVDVPGAPLRRRTAPIRTEEYYRDIQRALSANGVALIEPRELMLEAMRYFYDEAREHREEQVFWLRKLAQCQSEKDFADVVAGIDQAKMSTREFYLLAVDCGFKCAPYVHAKLSSMEVTGANKGPIEVIGLILKEIEQANSDRPSWAPPDLELEANE